MTPRNPTKLIPADFVTVPSLAWLAELTVRASESSGDVDAVARVVTSDYSLAELGLNGERITAAGFEGKPLQTLTLHRDDEPHVVLVGAGPEGELTEALIRDAAATAARAMSKWSRIAIVVDQLNTVVPERAAALIAEGAVLARYRYNQLQSKPGDVSLAQLDIIVSGGASTEVAGSVAEAEYAVRAACVTRDLTNTPPGHLTATNFADAAVELGAQFGFGVEIFDKQQLIELGCGGILGVNQGSTEEPRMVKLTWSGNSERHLTFVGKGIMYDSGGINLKPSDPMHLLMKMDMAGAAALLGVFSAVRDAGVSSRLTAWLMCTDNMPSGSAYKMGDVLRARNGKTVEVRNTDAEGRLAMMDGLALAAEEKPDAIIDIATLTGNAMLALGELTAALYGNNDALVERITEAAALSGEQVWRMPMERKHRKLLDSKIADLGNVGGKYAGAGQAALFLEEFVDSRPWAHLDIAGTMQTESDDVWRPAGATGYGARLLLEVARVFD